MKKHFKAVQRYCIEHDVEINFNPDEIGVWNHEGIKLPVAITDIEPEGIESAVAALDALKEEGWKTA